MQDILLKRVEDISKQFMIIFMISMKHSAEMVHVRGKIMFMINQW